MGGGIQWWCAAQGVAWSWEWRAYPGVWLFVIACSAALWLLSRRSIDASRGYLIAAILLLWLTLDWPVGALGAGYLASVHSLQYLVLAMVVPPLVLVGLRSDAARWIDAGSSGARAVRGLTSIPIALGFFVIVMLATHAPAVVDPMMRTQAGAFVLDFLWLLSGLAFWWQVIVPDARQTRFAPPLRMLYVFGGTVAHVFLAMWLILASQPVFATYELAPPIAGLPARVDQQLAGGVLLLIGSPLVIGAISLIFFRWQRESEMAM